MTHRTTTRRAALVVATLTLLSIPAVAQQNPAPAPATPPMGQMDHSMMGNMGGQGAMMACPMMPMMMRMMGGMGQQGGMMGNMGGMMGQGGQGGHDMGAMDHGTMAPGAMASAPDTAAVRSAAEHHATFTRAYYLALVAKGFTGEQALRIITSQPVPAGR